MKNSNLLEAMKQTEKFFYGVENEKFPLCSKSDSVDFLGLRHVLFVQEIHKNRIDLESNRN